MNFEVLELVILNRDLPEHGLRKGDLGTVVETYESDGVEVEFVTAAGDTRAVVTLASTDVRRVEAVDMLAVRPLR